LNLKFWNSDKHQIIFKNYLFPLRTFKRYSYLGLLYKKLDANEKHSFF
jgi:hypothetical protein